MALMQGPVNFLRQTLWSSCQRPFYIYLTTAVPCLVEAIIMLRTWDFGDMVRKTAETAGHGGLRRPPRGRHTTARTARQMKGTGKERFYKSYLKHLLIMTSPLEHIGFALLVWGVVDRFYFDWAMMLDDADACLSPGFYGNYIRRQTDGVCHPNNAGNAVQLPQLIHDGGNWVGNTVGVGVPIGRYQGCFACTVIGPGNGATYRLRLQVDGVIGTGNFDSEPIFVPEGAEVDLIAELDCFIPFVSGGHISWQIVGPPVPVGLVVPKADVFIQRRPTAFD